MQSETLAYKMQPAGHEEPAPRRKYAEPDMQVAKMFEKWLTRYKYAMDEYERAQKIIKGTNITIEQLHALLLRYQDHPNIEDSGELVSAVYNQIPEKEIIFDLDLATPIKNLGYHLKKDKSLINYSKLADGFGLYAKGRLVNYGTIHNSGEHLKGLIINLGKVEYGLGGHGEGIVINFGETGELFAHESNNTCSYENGHSCICINYGKAGKMAGSGANCQILLFAKDPESYSANINAPLLLKEQECNIPSLIKYLKEMKKGLEQGRHNPQKALETTSTLTCKGIESKIKQILKREHHVWE